MSKQKFSTGLPKFDQYLSGLRPGDSILAFLSDIEPWREFVRHLVQYASSEKIPLTYIAVDDSLLECFHGVKKFHHLNVGENGKKGEAARKSIKRFLSSAQSNSFVIVDDFSKWKSTFPTQRKLGDFLLLLTESVKRKKACLISSAIRSSLEIDSLTELKDSVSVCIDVIVHKDEAFCIPLTLKERYVPGGHVPFRFKLSELKKSTPLLSPAEVEVAGEQLSKISAEILAGDERFQKLFQDSSHAMFFFELYGDYREVNKRSEELLGYSSEELHAINPLSLVDERDRLKSLRSLVDLRRKKKVVASVRLLTKSSRQIPVDIHLSRLGEGLCFGIIHETADQQKLTRHLQQLDEELRAIIDNAAAGVLIVHNSKVLFANNESRRLFAAQAVDDFANKNLKELFDAPSVKALQKVINSTENIRSCEVSGVRTDGSAFECDARVSDVTFDGMKCSQISLLDISSRQQLVRTLTVAEERYRSLVTHSVEAAAVLEEGTYVFVNDAVPKLFSAGSSDEVRLKPFTDFVIEPERAHVQNILKKHVSTKQPITAFEYTGQRKDGSVIDVEVVLVSSAQQKDHRVFAFQRDVSDRKRLEQELRRRTEEMLHLDEIISALSFSHDPRKILQHTLLKLLHALSFEMGAMYLIEEKRRVLELHDHHNMPESFVARLAELSMEEGLGGYVSKTLHPSFFMMEKYPSYLAYRSLFREMNFSVVCLVPLLAHEKLVGMILLGSKKIPQEPSQHLLSAIGNEIGGKLHNLKVFRQIKAFEEQYRQLIEALSDVVYKSSADGKMSFISPNIESLVGYAPREFYRNPSLFLSLVHPDDKRILLQRITDLQQSGDRFVTEYRIRPKGKATYRWVRDVMTFTKDDGGMISGIQGLISDITTHREIIDELRSSNELKTSILTSIQEGVVVYDKALKVIQWNEAMEKITGLRRENVIGRLVADVFPGLHEQGTAQLLQQALGGSSISSEEFRYHIPQTQKQGYIWGRYSPLRDTQGEIIGVVGVVTDISERKQLEHELRESEQVLRNVIDTMSDILIITDLRGVVLQVNRAFLRVLGYSRAEAVRNEFPYPWLVEEEMGRYVLWIANLREKNWLHDFDMTWKTKEGESISMSLSTTLLRNSLGEPVAMLNIARDITERRRLVNELENRNKQVELINRIISAANQTMDINEIFTRTSKELAEIIQFDEMNIGLLTDDGRSMKIYTSYGEPVPYRDTLVPIDKTVAQFAIRAESPMVFSDLAADQKYASLLSFERGMRSQLSIPITLKGKTLGALNVLNREPYVFTDDHIPILQPVAQQIGVIIDRVQLFKQVSEDAAYIHNLLDSIDSVVYTVDTECRIREVNKAWHDFVHTSGVREAIDYHGKYLFDVLPNEGLKVLLQNVVDDLLSGAVKYFSQEFVQEASSGQRIYQVTINPMIIHRHITGLVVTHADITALKQTEQELKKNNEQLLALNEISTVISTSLNLETILDTAIPLLRKTIEADLTLVYFMEPDETGLTLVKHVGAELIPVEKIRRLPKSLSATGLVVRTKEPLYISRGVPEDNRIVRANQEILARAGIESMAVIPLMSKDRVLGALDVCFRQPNEFPSQIRQMLTLIGNQLGAAIENAQLYGELRSQIDRLTVLYELSQQLTSTLEIDQIFYEVCEHIRRIVQFDSFTIDMYDEDRNLITPAYAVRVVEGEQIIAPKTTQSTRLEPSGSKYEAISMKMSYLNAEQSLMYIPMLSKESIIGIMSLQGDGSKPYTNTHLRLIESIGSLAAIALQKGKLYEETVQKSLEIERRNKELDDFTYVVSHDLKEPLISIEGFSKILQLDYSDLLKQEGREYLESIVGASTRMKGLIDDLLMLSRVSRPAESLKVVSIKNVIDEIRNDMEFTIRQRGVSFIVDENLPSVQGNETHLKIVFRNLIGNALKFNDKPNPVVEIAFQNAENNYYLFSVRDNGIGIEKDFYEKIFVIFQRLHRREEYEGSGAGLAIVKKIIELHKGNIWVESEVGAGTTFFFTIPKVDVHES